MARYHYSVFGLRLVSDFRFDVLEQIAPADYADQVQILRTTGIKPRKRLRPDPYFDIQPDRQFLHWAAVGTYCIEDAQTVLIEPKDGVADDLVSQPLLGLVISLLLELRGTLCLHASAVSIGEKAAVFLGDKGAGKSTTVGAMLRRGHTPVTDDLVAVDDTLNTASAASIRPGIASMKLWPDAIKALALDADPNDRLIHPKGSKLQKPMPAAISQEPVSLGAFFILQRQKTARDLRADRKQPHAALQAVLRYTFMARYGETSLGRDHLVQHMKKCAALVANVPIYDLIIPEDLSRLDQIPLTIEPLLTR